MRPSAPQLALRLGSWHGARLRWWFLGTILLIVLVHLVRHLAPGPLAQALGSAPNFLAALGLPALLLSQRERPWFSRSAAAAPLRWGLGVVIASQVLLLGWEFTQVSIAGMLFDFQDIVATWVGGLVWCLTCVSVPQRTAQAD